jgi:hypothetical protein
MKHRTKEKTMSGLSGVDRVIKEAGGVQQLADAMNISYQAVRKFKRQGWLPLERARKASDDYGVALRDLVRPDIADALGA